MILTSKLHLMVSIISMEPSGLLLNFSGHMGQLYKAEGPPYGLREEEVVRGTRW